MHVDVNSCLITTIAALLLTTTLTACQKATSPDAGPPMSPALRETADQYLFVAEHLRIEKVGLGKVLAGDLAAGRYDDLEAALNDLDQTARNDPRYEFVYRDALDAIVSCNSPNDSVERPLLDLEEVKPHSPWPHVLLGHYYEAMACHARGTGWARDVSQDQLHTMENFDRRAYTEYREAMAINPNLFPVYDGLMIISNGLGSLDEITAVYKQASQHLPRSYLLAADYMNALKPRWHGNYSLMHRFANEMRPLTTRNPRFYDLGGYVAADQANLAYNDHDFTDALRLYSLAIQYADYPSWLEWGAESAVGLRQYRIAYAYYKRYLFYKPQDADAQKRLRELAPFCTSPSPLVCRGDQGFPWAGEVLPNAAISPYWKR